MRADQATIHAFLVEQLSECKKELIDFAFRHGAVVCLVLGWLVSSEQAQRFFAASPWIQALSSIGLFIYALLYSRWVYLHYRHSRGIFRDLETNAFMDSKLFAFLLVRFDFALSFILLHEMLCVTMIVFIWMIPHYHGALFHPKP